MTEEEISKALNESLIKTLTNFNVLPPHSDEELQEWLKVFQERPVSMPESVPQAILAGLTAGLSGVGLAKRLKDKAAEILRNRAQSQQKES